MRRRGPFGGVWQVLHSWDLASEFVQARGQNAADRPAGRERERKGYPHAGERSSKAEPLAHDLGRGRLLWNQFAGFAQLPPAEEERLQILSDPEALKKKAEKDKNRPPFEFFRSRVAPFDVIPYVKANHWSTLNFELRANDDDYDGFLQTDPVRMLVGSQQVSYRREARLLKEKRASLACKSWFPLTTPRFPRNCWLRWFDRAHSGPTPTGRRH